MTNHIDELENARQRIHEANQAVAEELTRMADLIESALRAGIPQKEVSKATDYSSEHIRRIARARSVPRIRKPTVRSLKEE